MLIKSPEQKFRAFFVFPKVVKVEEEKHKEMHLWLCNIFLY